MTFVSAPIAIGTADTLIYQCPPTLEGSVHGLQFENYSGGAVLLTIKLFKQATGVTSTVRSKSLAAGEEYEFTKINVSAGDRVLATAATSGTVRALANAYVDTATPAAVGFTPRGTWLVGSAYAVNDVVEFDGSSYIARAANTGSQPPSANWMLMSAKGQQGPAGSGAGDMVAATYDPSGKGADAFSMANMVETTTKKIMTDTERTKLAGVDAGANAYVHPSGDGSSHVPPTGTSNSGKFLKAGAAPNSQAWVQPTKSDVGLANVDNTSDAAKPVSADTAAALATKAPLNSPALTGTPTAPTAAQGTGSEQLATTAFVQAAIAALIDGAPGAIDTLNELAAAMGDDPNFAATVTNSLASKLNSSAVSSFMMTLLDDASATAARTTLQLGTSATMNEATVAELRSATADKVLTAELIEAAAALVTLTFATTLSINWDAFLVAEVTATANFTIANPSNVQPGTTRYILVKGSSTTARTLSFGTSYKGNLPTDTVTTTAWLLIGLTAITTTHIVVTSCKAL